MLDLLLKKEKVDKDEYVKQLEQSNCLTDDETITSVQRIFELEFFSQNSQKKYGEKPILSLQNNKIYMFNDSIRKSLEQNEYFKYMVMDIVRSSKEKGKNYECDSNLTVYKKYSRKDVCKLLNWHNDESSTMYGYKTKYYTCPIFITYHKNDEVESSVDYGDEFLNQDVLKWYTRSNRTLKSKEVQTIIDAKENNIDVHIFVKKMMTRERLLLFRKSET